MQFNSPTGAGISSDVKLQPAKKTVWRLTYHQGGGCTLEDHGHTTTFATRKEYEDYLESKKESLVIAFVAE